MNRPQDSSEKKKLSSTAFRFVTKGATFVVIAALAFSVVQATGEPKGRQVLVAQDSPQEALRVMDQDAVSDGWTQRRSSAESASTTSQKSNEREARISIAAVQSNLTAMRQAAVDSLEKLIAGNRRGGAHALIRIRFAIERAIKWMKGVTYPVRYRWLAGRLNVRLKALRVPTMATIHQCGPFHLRDHAVRLGDETKQDVRQRSDRACRLELGALVRSRLDNLQELMTRIRPLLEP